MKFLNHIKAVLVYTGILFLGLQSCYEKVEGCLDINAVNFDVQADKNGECEYPYLNTKWIHQADSFSFEYGKVYTNDLGSPFSVNTISFYLSGFKIINENGQEFSVNDEIELHIKSPGNVTSITNFIDDFALILPGRSSARIGTFVGPGSYSALKFVIGVDGEANFADPTLLEEDHPLSIQEESMHWDQDQGYIFAKIALKKDISSNEITVLENGGSENLVEVLIPYVQQIPRGKNIDLNLKIDYLKWFDGIDFENDTNAEIIQKIRANMPASFSKYN